MASAGNTCAVKKTRARGDKTSLTGVPSSTSLARSSMRVDVDVADVLIIPERDVSTGGMLQACHGRGSCSRAEGLQLVFALHRIKLPRLGWLHEHLASHPARLTSPASL